MRRISYVALGALLVLAIGGVIWWRGSSSQPSPHAPVTSGTAPAAASPSSELVLQINRTTTATIAPGASVFFTVTLTGAAAEPWTSGVRFESREGKPLAFRIEPLGAPFTVRAADARKETSEMRQAGFGIDPEEARRISTGSHTIRAVLLLDEGAPDRRSLVSNTVTLTMDRPQAGATESADSEKARLESVAQFSLLSERWEAAHGAALRLVERADADASAFILLGDALNGLKRDDEALAAYHEALASLPRDLDESPDYLIARMEEVQRRLEAAKARK